MKAMSHSVHHPSHHPYLERANSVLLLTMVCGGLAACAAGAIVFDLGRIFGAW
jgi:hypothetical protein